MQSSAQAGPQRCELLRFPVVVLCEEADDTVTVKDVCRSVL